MPVMPRISSHANSPTIFCDRVRDVGAAAWTRPSASRASRRTRPRSRRRHAPDGRVGRGLEDLHRAFHVRAPIFLGLRDALRDRRLRREMVDESPDLSSRWPRCRSGGRGLLQVEPSARAAQISERPRREVIDHLTSFRATSRSISGIREARPPVTRFARLPFLRHARRGLA